MRALLLASASIFLLVTTPPRTTAQVGGEGELKHLTASINALRPSSLTALSIERGTNYPSLIRLKGSVEIKTPVCLPVGNDGAPVCDGEMIVRADEAEFHEDTGEIQAHGNVQITPLQHRLN